MWGFGGNYVRAVVQAHPAMVTPAAAAGTPAYPAYQSGLSPEHDAAFRHASATCLMGDTEAKVYATDPSLGFSAKVPPGFEAGRFIQVRTSSGHLVPLQIPAGKGPGEIVHVRCMHRPTASFCQPCPRSSSRCWPFCDSFCGYAKQYDELRVPRAVWMRVQGVDTCAFMAATSVCAPPPGVAATYESRAAPQKP